MLPDYEPVLTFVPQCADCKRAYDEDCPRQWLLLYRRNFIRCADRVSEKPFYEPNGGIAWEIEDEMAENAAAYGDNAMAEARATWSRLVASGEIDLKRLAASR